MKLGFPISIGLHLAFVGAGLIAFSGELESFEDSRIIPIELVTLSDTTNISAAIRKPKNEDVVEAELDAPMTLQTPMDFAEEEAPQTNRRTEEVLEKTAEAVLPPTNIDPTAPPIDEEKKDQVETPQEPVFDLNKLSSLVNKTRDTAPEKNQQKTLQSEQNSYRFAEAARSASGEGTDMTLSEMDALQSAMYKCWRMPADAKNPEKLVVSVSVKLLPGGFVDDVRLKDKTKSRLRDPGNPFWEVAEQRAIRAVSQCAPYDFLPKERYNEWRELTLNFAPRL